MAMPPSAAFDCFVLHPIVQHLPNSLTRKMNFLQESIPPAELVVCSAAISRCSQLASKEALKNRQPHCGHGPALKSLFLIALYYRLTRERVNVLLKRHLIILFILCQLVPYIFSYLCSILSHGVHYYLCGWRTSTYYTSGVFFLEAKAYWDPPA